MQIHGYVDEKFARTMDVFAEGFSSGREVGAAFSVAIDGETVVDLWAGHTDRKRTQAWQENTLACCFSVTKAISATCVLQAVDQQLIDLDVPVAQLWPEFAAGGKEQITVRHIMSHRAGLPAFSSPVDRALLYDWDQTIAALAQQTPWWQPGTAHGYHARTYGFLLGEVLRRASGRSIGAWLRERIAVPESLEVWIGLPESEHHRCADMLPAKIRPDSRVISESAREMMRDFGDINTVTGATFNNPTMGAGYMNKPPFRSAEMPAMNGHATARDLARFFSNIPRHVSSELLQEATKSHSLGPDRVLKSETSFGLGYMVHSDSMGVAWPGCFGHAGAGGSLAFCDPEQQLGFAFVMNQMEEGVIAGGTSAMRLAATLEAK